MGADTTEVVEELTRPVIKLLLALVGLFVLRFIVNNLPGLGTQIPGTSVAATAVLAAIITLTMVGILVNFGIEIEPRLQRALSGPQEVINDLAEIVKFLVFLVAIIVAYDGLAAVAVPFLLPDLVWVYDVVFLLAALVPTALVAQRMFSNLDELTDLLTKQVKSATVQDVDCPECGETVRLLAGLLSLVWDGGPDARARRARRRHRHLPGLRFRREPGSGFLWIVWHRGRGRLRPVGAFALQRWVRFGTEAYFTHLAKSRVRGPVAQSGRATDS